MRRTSTLLLLLLAAGCGADDSASAGGGGAVSRGGELYARSCAMCHGGDLEGTAVAPALLDTAYGADRLDDEELARVMVEGVPAERAERGLMPPNRSLDDDDVADLVAFVRERQRVGAED